MSAHLAGRRPVFAGMWYDNSAWSEPSVPRANTASMPSGFAMYAPFIAPRDFTASALATIVGTAVAATSARLGIYADSGACAPGTLLLDAGTVSTASTGLQSAAVSLPFVGGQLYWLASQVSANGVFLQLPAASGTPFLGLLAATDAATIKRAYNSMTFGVFPASAPAVTRDSVITVPSLLVQAA